MPAELVPDPAYAPTPIERANVYSTFSKGILNAVADLVGVVKFQSAFFESAGFAGMAALDFSMRYAASLGLVVVLDGKRGDIGSTAEAYAEAYVDASAGEQRAWPADALTVNPFLGRETLEPFVTSATTTGTGLFILVRTSNPGSADLQMMSSGAGTISEMIGRWVEEWSRESKGPLGYGSIGAVVGATHREEIATFRALMPTVPMLLPGYGTQGGRGADLALAFDAMGLGAVVNNSRGIIFAFRDKAYEGVHWQDAARAATEAMIADLRSHTPAGNL
jgi:orotidine-5'-phosphate decarboxylase